MAQARKTLPEIAFHCRHRAGFPNIAKPFQSGVPLSVVLENRMPWRVCQNRPTDTVGRYKFVPRPFSPKQWQTLQFVVTLEV
jgi:hypothetical protein